MFQIKSIKNNKKAFTLIEILAVIVIIGIILLVVSIPVTKYVENSKIKTYQSHEKELEIAVKDYMIECLSNNEVNKVEEECVFPSIGKYAEVLYKTLVDNGYSNELEDPDSDGYCSQSYVRVENNDGGVNFDYKVCLICSKYKTAGEWCEYLN